MLGGKILVMTTKKLEEKDWRGYFSRISHAAPCHEVRIEYVGEKVGDQIDADWQPVQGIEYLPQEREFHILCGKQGHLIKNPIEVFIREEGFDLSALEVIAAGKVKYIVSFRRPLPLPSAER